MPGEVNSDWACEIKDECLRDFINEIFACCDKGAENIDWRLRPKFAAVTSNLYAWREITENREFTSIYVDWYAKFGRRIFAQHGFYAALVSSARKFLRM